MSSLAVLFACGAVGGLAFEFLRLPGGAMTGSMIAVVLLNTFTHLPATDTPRVIELSVYICLGVVIGNMYKPGMLLAVRHTWPVLVLSTLTVLLAGIFCTWLVHRSGVLSLSGAYLATSPGGLTAVAGLAADMGSEAPIVLIYHLVRLYAIFLIAPYMGKMLQLFFR